MGARDPGGTFNIEKGTFMGQFLGASNMRFNAVFLEKRALFCVMKRLRGHMPLLPPGSDVPEVITEFFKQPGQNWQN